MNYSEFKNTYKWMLKKYSDISSLYGVKISLNCITENYIKVGTKWSLQDSKTENNISNEYYYNCVDAIPFFRNLGGKEIISLQYTKYGYIPTQINSISPDRKQKTIRKFIFS